MKYMYDSECEIHIHYQHKQMHLFKQNMQYMIDITVLIIS